MKRRILGLAFLGLLILALDAPMASSQYSGVDYTRIARPDWVKKPRFDREKFDWQRYVLGGPRAEESGLFLNANTIVESETVPAPQNESSIAISPIDPSFLIASAVDSRAGAWVYVSRDGGESWSNISLGVVNGNWQSGNDPSVGFYRDGTAYVMYGAFPRPTTGESGVYIARSTDNGETWESHIPVIEHRGLMTADSAFEDKYYIEIDNVPGSPYDGWLYTPWKRVTDRDSATEIVFTRSTDAGTTWSTPIGISPRKPGTSTHITFGQSFPLVKTGPNGEIYAVWNDGPDRSIGFARSTDGGDTWTDPTYPVSGYEYLGTDRFLLETRITIDTIDPGGANERYDTTRTTDTTARYHVLKETFRAETYPTITVDVTDGPRKGWIYLCWASGRFPDIWFVRSEDRGDTWSEPMRVHPADNSDQWWPWISLDETNGDLAVMYSDSRRDPENIFIDTWVSYSSDGGSTWIDRRATDAVSDFRDNPFVDQVFAGDYSGNAFHDGVIYPSFLDTRTDNDVYTAVVDIRQPYPVDNLTVTTRVDDLSEARLTWDPVPFETTFGLALDTLTLVLERDGTPLAIIGGRETSFVDPARDSGVTYTYRLRVATEADTSVDRTVEFRGGGALLPAAPEIVDVFDYRPTVEIEFRLPGVRADGVTPLSNLAGYRVYRDGEVHVERNVAASDTGERIVFGDTPQERGFYRYTITAFDDRDPANESIPIDTILVYSGSTEEYSLDEDRAYPLATEGTWDYTDEIAYTGTLSLTDSPDEDYPRRTSTSARIFPVESSGRVRVRFQHIALVRTNDTAAIEYSLDSGKTWTEFARYDNSMKPSWTDNRLDSDDWLAGAAEVLTPMGAIVDLRFRLGSGVFGEDRGWFVDDIVVETEVASVRPSSSFETFGIEVFPNPTTGSFMVDVAREQTGLESWVLVDRLGRVVAGGTALFGGKILTPIDLPSGIAAGSYRLVVDPRTERLTRPVILLP